MKRSIGLGYSRKTFRLVYILLLFFFTVFPFPDFLTAQIKDYKLEHLSSADGLSQSSVLKIFQYSRNFLWFATFDGLKRYDRYNFKVYRSSITDTTAISGQGFGLFNKLIGIFTNYKNDPYNIRSLDNIYIICIYKVISGITYLCMC
ncbi:MAG: hypothetical protein WCA84_07100 [Ignavibacteriaceae bacterium]